MRWMQLASPHTLHSLTTAQVMRQVMLACLPGIAALSFFFGPGVLINILLACLSCVAAEALVLYWRQRSWRCLHDGSALLTGLLLGICLPATAPWWIPISGGFFAILCAKQLFGGLGQNPFNPAMAAYALLLVSFPLPMSQWPLPLTLDSIEGWRSVAHLDGWTGATALDAWRNKGLLMADEFWASGQLLPEMLHAWAWVAGAWCLGGGYLLWRRLIPWHTPVAFFATIFLAGALVWGWDTSHQAPPWLHFAAGSVVFAGFFILTDPVSGATSLRGKVYFAIGVGLLVISIRTWGSYPDGVAFSVLLMNAAAPALDYFTRPRIYGQDKAVRGMRHQEPKK